MSHINRRTVVAGIAGVVPAAVIGAAPVLSSPALAQLIEGHRTAWQAFSNSIDLYDLYDDDEATDKVDPVYFAARDAEDEALFALCSYRCQSIEEAAAKGRLLVDDSRRAR